jgi:hypothetical protein
MNILKLLPVILSFLLLAAHFYRSEMFILSIFSLLIPFTLFIKSKWIPGIIQIILILGSFEWLRTTILFVAERKMANMPWIRLCIILVSVALFTALTGLVFKIKSIKEIYQK